jgi:hypothetical protein
MARNKENSPHLVLPSTAQLHSPVPAYAADVVVPPLTAPSPSSSSSSSLSPAKSPPKNTKNKRKKNKANKTISPPAVFHPTRFYYDPIAIAMTKYTLIFEQLILSESISTSSPSSDIKPAAFYLEKTHFLGPHRVNKVSRLLNALLHYQQPTPYTNSTAIITLPEAFHDTTYWFTTTVSAFNYLEALKSPNYLPIDTNCPIVTIYLSRYACVIPCDVISGASRWQRLIFTDPDLYDRAKARAIFSDTGSAAGWMVNLGWADDELVALFLTCIWVESKIIRMVAEMVDGEWSDEAFNRASAMAMGGGGGGCGKCNINNMDDLVKWLGDVLGSDYDGGTLEAIALSCLVRVLGQ